MFEVERGLDRVGMVGPRALALDELTQQSDRDELEGRHDQKHSEHQERPITDRAKSNEPEHAQIGQDDSSR
jgi:hypothetical protein